MSITFTEMENRARAALFAAGYSSSEITNEMILDKLRELFGQVPGQPVAPSQTDGQGAGSNNPRIVWDK